MPYIPTTPTLILCDDLVGYLSDLAKPKAPATVSRAYLARIDLATLKGRQVIFFPTGYNNEPASRGEDNYTHRVTALIATRYTDAADPEQTVPQEWVDQEVDFVHTYIVQGLAFFRDGTQPTFNRKLQTLSAEVAELYEPEKLATKKEFWCAVEMVFLELLNV